LPGEWEDIPVLKRGDLINDFLSKIPPSSASEKLYISHSSGSSGQPIFFARDAFSHAYVWTVLDECYANVGISLNHRQARVFGVSGSKLNKIKVRLKDLMSNRYRFNVFDLSDQALEKWLTIFRKEHFEYIYGYSNSLIVFANFLKSKGLLLSNISESIKACIVTSEVCTDKDTILLEEAFGVPVYNEYGSSELGLMGFKKDGFWEVPDHLLYIEVLDENGNVLPDGEVGYLVCTALFNKATPFIRYQNGDLGSIRRVNGRTRIEQLMGSLNDQAVLPSGKKVPGISFYFVAQELLESSSKVKEFLFRQKEGVFIFEYVADEDLTEIEIAKLKKGLTGTLGQGLQLQTKRVSALQRGASGKFKHFISTKD
jgi:phenylacetate-CoA ligase